LSGPDDFLDTMARASESRARELVTNIKGGELERRAREAPVPPRLRLSPAGFDVIAEVKLSSPSVGTLAHDASGIGSRCSTYASAGACAVSILTEPDRFRGDIEHLRQGAAALAPLQVPAMAKDFFVAPEQLCAARLAGAGGALLIVRMLDDSRLTEMMDMAMALGLFVLLEMFDEHDMERASEILRHRRDEAGSLLLGLNCRDLKTLTVDPARFGDMARHFPQGPPRVAESGIETPGDAAAVASLGYAVALVGTALMRTGDPAGMLAGMIDRGRAASRVVA